MALAKDVSAYKRSTRRPTRLGQQGMPVYVKPDKGDPIGGFLGAVKDVVTFGNKETIQTGKKVFKAADRYANSRLRAFVPDRKRGKPRPLAQMPRNSMDISPGMIGAIIRAGGAKIMTPGRLDLDELVSRLPTQSSRLSKVQRVALDKQAASSSDRFPFILDERFGNIRAGRRGQGHWPLYPEARPMDEFGQGWVYHPLDDFMDLQLGLRGRQNPSGPEQKALYEFLYTLFGRNSPITDAMVKPGMPMKGFGG